MTDELKPCPGCGSNSVSKPTGERGWLCRSCGSEWFGDYNSRPAEDALRAAIAEKDAEIARLREADRWIPVEERLPERAMRVLVYTVEYRQYTAWLDWVNRDGEPLFVYYEVPGKTVYLDSVTHWHPLPLPLPPEPRP